MSSEVMFSIVMFKDGTVEVTWREKETLKVFKLRPKNPVVALLPLLSALGLAMGSDILLKQHITSLVEKIKKEEEITTEAIRGDP